VIFINRFLKNCFWLKI